MAFGCTAAFLLKKRSPGPENIFVFTNFPFVIYLVKMIESKIWESVPSYII